MAANAYIRHQRRLAIRFAAKSALSYGSWVLVFYLGQHFFPRTTMWFNVAMWILLASMCLLSIGFAIHHHLTHSRARKWMSQECCPGCGYDRNGLQPDDVCPECASPNKVIDPAPPIRDEPAAPKGRPVCARCGGDMTGRENRTCPSCGAMCGIDYFED